MGLAVSKTTVRVTRSTAGMEAMAESAEQAETVGLAISSSTALEATAGGAVTAAPAAFKTAFVQGSVKRMASQGPQAAHLMALLIIYAVDWAGPAATEGPRTIPRVLPRAVIDFIGEPYVEQGFHDVDHGATEFDERAGKHAA